LLNVSSPSEFVSHTCITCFMAFLVHCYFVCLNLLKSFRLGSILGRGIMMDLVLDYWTNINAEDVDWKD
jgi:hypothetical protein